MKRLLRKLVPLAALRLMRPWYHGFLAKLAAAYYRHPGRKMAVIGVTGTSGKSTVVRMLAHILNRSGRKCGFVTTVGFFDGVTEQVNRHGLSMPGGPLLQRQLAAMVAKGCDFAIVECTSEGLAQNRHLGIDFLGAVFTNLAPAHLEAHGSFANYRAAKGRLFDALRGQGWSVTNLDDSNSDYFLQFPTVKKIGVTEARQAGRDGNLDKVFICQNITAAPSLSFSIDQTFFSLPVMGRFNAANGALAVAAAFACGVSLDQSAAALRDLPQLPGRMETVPNAAGVTVVVDYAPEPAGLRASMAAVRSLPSRRLIHLFGSTGGHRDRQKRFEFGTISAESADHIIVTNDDVYDSDPEQIAGDITAAIQESARAKAGQLTWETVLDRRQAIRQAVGLARPGDLLLLTGKGSEQFLVLPGNRRIPWDERQVVSEEFSAAGKEPRP